MLPKLHAGIFYGHLHKRQRVGGLILTEHVYAASLEIPRHVHERAYLCTVIHGSYTEADERGRHRCDRSTVVFHPVGEIHADSFGPDGGRVFGIEPDAEQLRRLKECAGTIERRWECQGGPTAWLAHRLYQEFKNPEQPSPLVIEGLFLALLGETARHDKAARRGPPSWLRRAHELLSDRFAEPVSVDEVAHAAGVHPVHLARSFRRAYGCTIGEFVRQMRVTFACDKLVRSTAPLVDIALAAGFADQSQFGKTFRRYTGMTPSHFRRAARSR